MAYAADAIAFDRELDVGREFTRKVRTLAGNFQLMALMPSLLAPTHPAFNRFFWHKTARLVAEGLAGVIRVAYRAEVASAVVAVLQAVVASVGDLSPKLTETLKIVYGSAAGN